MSALKQQTVHQETKKDVWADYEKPCPRMNRKISKSDLMFVKEKLTQWWTLLSALRENLLHSGEQLQRVWKHSILTEQGTLDKSHQRLHQDQVLLISLLELEGKKQEGLLG